MRADPELTAGWTAAQLGSVLIHHVCHLLRTHGERAQGTGVRPDEAADWIRAADAEINDDLVPAGLELPGLPVLPRDLRAEDGLLAEQYFDGIRRAIRASEGPGGYGGAGSSSQGGSGGMGPPGKKSRGGLGGSFPPAEKEPAGLRRERGRIARPVRVNGLTADPERTGFHGPVRGEVITVACRAGRPTCCGGRSRRTSSRTASSRGPCRPGCCAGPRRSSARRSTGAPCSPPSCAAPSPRSPARSTTPTAGRPAGPPWPGRSCCRRCGGRYPRWPWSATPRAA